MTAIVLTVTDAGRAALVNAAAGGTNAVTIAACGITASAFAPVPALTALPGEFVRLATLSGEVVDADTIHLIVRDAGTSVYAMFGFGLYLADGTLFAVYGQSAAIVDKTAVSTMLLALDIRFADIAAASLTFGDTDFLDPPATTEVMGVVELATAAEAEAATDTQRAVTPATLGAVLDGRFGQGSASAFVRSLLTAASAAAFRVLLGIKGAASFDPGSGNGLDADTLDGVHAGSVSQVWPFVPVVAASGVMEVGKYIDFHSISADPADYATRLTAAPGGQLAIGGTVAWTGANDGSGSGLDADLLDGLDSSYFTNIPARLGFTPVNQTNPVMNGLATILGGLRIAAFSYANGPSITLDNRGANVVPDNTTFRIGGYYFSTLRDVANPAYAAGMWAERTPAVGGLASSVNLVFGADPTGSGNPTQIPELGRFQANGYFGIGTPAPAAPLHVARDGTDLTLATVARFSNTAQTKGIDIGYSVAGSRVYISSSTLGQLDFNPYGGLVTIAGQTAWHAGNDGSGSGLDADLVRGSSPTVFLRGDTGGYWQLASNNPILGAQGAGLLVREANFAGPQGNSPAAAPGFSLYWNGVVASQLRLAPDGGVEVRDIMGTGFQILRAGSLFSNGQTVWSAGNDGSGSGLDADMLRGIVPSTPQAGNTVVVRDGSGHVYANYLNSLSPVNENPPVDQIMVTNGADYFLRKVSLTSFTTQLIARGGVWTAANDGAGSGLDADLVRGLAPSTPQAPFTVVVRDGAGHVYADYFNSAAPANENPSVDQVIVSPAGDQFFRRASLTNFTAQLIARGGVWTAANDGSGSGLDADLVRGAAPSTGAGAGTIAARDGAGQLAATNLVQTSAPNENPLIDQIMVTAAGDNALRKSSLANLLGALISDYALGPNGHLRLGPVLLQWGQDRTYRNFEGSFTTYFGESFSNVPFVIMATSINPSSSNNRDTAIQIVARTAAGFTGYCQNNGGGGSNSDGFDWFAVGPA